MKKQKDIKFTVWYIKQYLSQPEAFQDLLDNFESTAREYGLWGGKLDGAVRKSDRVSKDSPYYQQTMDLCNEYRLYHYHVGWEAYAGKDSEGKHTSNWVVHIHVEDAHTYRFVGLGKHSPMHLPL